MSLLARMNAIMSEEIDKETIEVVLDLHTGTKKEITLKQADHNSRILKVSLTKNMLHVVKLHNSRVDLYIRKVDGTVAVVEGSDISAEDGVAYFSLTRQCLSTPPSIECEVVKTGNDGSTLSFPLFTINVSDSIYDADEIESSNELSNLTSALLKAEQANDRVDSAVSTTEKKFEQAFNSQSQEFSNAFNQAQTARADEFQTWKNLAMQEQVAINLQDQINNMPFYRIIEG